MISMGIDHCNQRRSYGNVFGGGFCFKDELVHGIMVCLMLLSRHVGFVWNL